MAYEKITKILIGDTPGRSTELNYYRIGPNKAEKKVYLQAALHADEQPGILILHHLLELLKTAEQRGELNARFVIFPMVNPLGMADIEFGRHQGRYNRSSGINHNRQWPDILEPLDASIGEALGNDEVQNIAIIRERLRRWAAELPELKAEDQWRKAIISEACDADYVFDLHCDEDALVHIFSVPQLTGAMQQLADWTGAAATMMTEDSGGGSFDEIWPAVWLKLASVYPDLSIPLAVKSCTLEYRGNFDVFDDLNNRDAENLFAYFQQQGLIGGGLVAEKGSAAAATDLRATEYLRAEHAGLVIYSLELGAKVKKGDQIAELLHLDGDDAFVGRTPVLAGTDGLLISRNVNKYVWRNAQIGKIVGSEIIESRGDYLLGD